MVKRLFITPLVFARLFTEPHTRTHRFARTGKRSEIFLGTKFGAGSPSGKLLDCSPEYVKQALNKSLKKLGTDYIDLYYAHR